MKKSDKLKKIIKDGERRGHIFSALSLILTAFFAIYNLYLGLAYRLIWNASIMLYYLILLVIKSIIMAGKRRWRALDSAELDKKQRTLVNVVNVFLIIVDLALFAPVTIMVLGARPVGIGMIPAIAVAAFTTYKVTMAIISFQRARKSSDIILRTLKTISLKEAVVSVITLQNTLIMTFGDFGSMIALTACTSAALLLWLIAISVYQIIRVKK